EQPGMHPLRKRQTDKTKKPRRGDVEQTWAQPPWRQSTAEGAAPRKNKSMSSSLVKIDIHLVFHVKSTRIPMREEDLPRIFQFIGGLIRGQGGIPMEVGGVCNHVHILTSLPKTMALTDFVRNVKAASSKWIKQIDGYYDTFAWQDGYGAFSVSPSLLDKTEKYIARQAEHHKKTTLREEYKMILDRYGIEYDDNYFLCD
ncbi:MAG: transposase, partial [Bacteroidales bacterium]|nr:transposase [Bacteroidales bacterium]